jgi:hypothetical protein
MKVTVNEKVLKHLGGIVRYEVMVGGEYYGTAADQGELIILKTQAISFAKDHVERRRKQVWAQLQEAHKLPEAERTALKIEYQQLLKASVKGVC